jgi:SAM-dependent methyltransferase
MTDTSTQSTSAYVLGHPDAELQRLAEQSAFYADLTEDAFRRAGLAPGMRVLDVGCGAGEVSLLAAATVGPAARCWGSTAPRKRWRSPGSVRTPRASRTRASQCQAGARDNGAPSLRPNYHANYYGAFVLDPDGYNIEAVCHKPEP